MLEIQSKELRVRDLVPCRPYTLSDLRVMGTLDLPTAVSVSGQTLSTFDDPDKYKELADRMMGRKENIGDRVIYRDPQSGRFRSRDGVFALAVLVKHAPSESKSYELYKYPLTSELFNRLNVLGVSGLEPVVEYNQALHKGVFNPEDAASLEFQQAFKQWDQNLSPFRGSLRLSSNERFSHAYEQANALEMTWGVASYMREYMQEQVGKPPAHVIREKLGELLSWPKYFSTEPETALGQRIQTELGLIIANPDLVVLAYARVDDFRKQYADQIQQLADAFEKPNRSDSALRYASELRSFLQS